MAEWIDAKAAAKFLGVSMGTLYTYAGRGLVARIDGASHRQRKYSVADLHRLAERREARRGRGAIAADALNWGSPIVDSAITSVRGGRLRYRGVNAIEFATGGSFEHVAELLWGAAPGVAPDMSIHTIDISDIVETLKASQPIDAIAMAVLAAGARDPGRFTFVADVERSRARAILQIVSVAPAVAAGQRRVRAAVGKQGVAARLATALGARHANAAEAIERALVLCADHELNASAFAARIAAAAGADVYACVAAGLCALSGFRHGGACDRVEALIAEARVASKPSRVVADRLRRGESVPGFGHRLYPDGDPRTQPLLDAAKQLTHDHDDHRVFEALIAGAREAGLGAPAVDFGLVAVTSVLGLAPGSACAVFAVGRTAGLVAHVLEQRTSPELLRPRARYVGPETAPMPSEP